MDKKVSHPLRTWRRAEKRSAQAVANALGVKLLTIYRWETGARMPAVAHATQIESLSKGHVTQAQLYAAYVALQSARCTPPTEHPAVAAGEGETASSPANRREAA